MTGSGSRGSRGSSMTRHYQTPAPGALTGTRRRAHLAPGGFLDPAKRDSDPALRIAELTPGEERWRLRLQGYAWGPRRERQTGSGEGGRRRGRLGARPRALGDRIAGRSRAFGGNPGAGQPPAGDVRRPASRATVLISSEGATGLGRWVW